MLTFTAEHPRDGEYGIVGHGPRAWLARGTERRFPVADLALPGRHNSLNALAAMAIADDLGIDGEAIDAALRTFRGLAHRCEPIGCARGVRWYDDSKGTNVGATVAAVSGFDVPLVLIAGGDGKGADFEPLGRALRESAGRIRKVVLLGRDAPVIRSLVEARTGRERGHDVRGGRPGARGGAAGRCGAALSGLRELGHVPRLSRTGPGLPGRRCWPAGAAGVVNSVLHRANECRSALA